MLYDELGFRRKAGFFTRVAAMQCVSQHLPHPLWVLVRLGEILLGLSVSCFCLFSVCVIHFNLHVHYFTTLKFQSWEVSALMVSTGQAVQI